MADTMAPLLNRGVQVDPQDQDQSYFMASDEESRRLSDQHAVTKNAMPNGQLVCVPLDLTSGHLRILDSGTADGTWIIDLNATTGGRHTFVGTDVNTVELPRTSTSNITFHTQDINSPWPAEYTASFDLVHQRLVMAFAGSQSKLAVSRLTDMVKPGGWIQLLEAPFTTPDSVDENPHVNTYLQIVCSVYSSLGAPLTLSTDIPRWLGEFGFEHIHSQEVVVPFGAANPDAELGRRGALTQRKAAGKMVEVASKLPELPISKERLDTFADDFGIEMMEKGMRLPIQLIWAQKPE